MTLLIVYGMTSLITGAVSAAGSVPATSAHVGATPANQTDGANHMIASVKRQVQGAVASAVSAA